MDNACPFQSRVEAYHDGELANDADVRASVEQHLAACPACAEDLVWLRRVTAEMRDGARRDYNALTASELARIHDAIDTEADAAERTAFDLRRLYRAAVALTAVAASILLLSCAWLNELPGQTTGVPRTNEGVAVREADAWERVAATLEADPTLAPNPVASKDANFADWMLNGLAGKPARETTP